MRILVAEDDVRLAGLLEESLAEAGWQVEVVHNGRVAYDRLLSDTSFDVALLDWMLPGMDGVTVARRLRGLGLALPILMLTARGDVRDRIDGLDAGADDYLPKPFDLDELLARLRALYRRGGLGGEAPVQIGDLVVDPGARRVSRGGVEIILSTREFDILYLLASHAGQVVTRLTILDEVWDGETDLRSNVIDVHLAAIRGKIDKPFGTDTITTLRGVGYRLDIPAGKR
ncbi:MULTISPECIES: response regulator transcription factor [unclassified Nocardioides]|uniref:response regulator transcription factor n=1 Tax=unclassified Nocardioides TaxID=2615069 RepID=UPI0000571C0C|nr:MULTISPECIES: response regulator transcription factor [unclassified Nocardioides]ABL81073.1 response regulator receiver [Nocardioides sp. JS614]